MAKNILFKKSMATKYTSIHLCFIYLIVFYLICIPFLMFVLYGFLYVLLFIGWTIGNVLQKLYI